MTKLVSRPRGAEGVSRPEGVPFEPALDFLQRLWQLNHALEQLSSRMEKHFGLTAQQGLVLRCIGRHRDLTAGRLANLLYVDPGTVSATLNRLEDKGLIVRRRDPRDKRRVALRLTTEGRALASPTDGTVECAVERLLATVSQRNVQATVKVIEQLTRVVSEELCDDPRAR